MTRGIQILLLANLSNSPSNMLMNDDVVCYPDPDATQCKVSLVSKRRACSLAAFTFSPSP